MQLSLETIFAELFLFNLLVVYVVKLLSFTNPEVTHLCLCCNKKQDMYNKAITINSKVVGFLGVL